MKTKYIVSLIFTICIVIIIYFISGVDQSKVIQKKNFDKNTSDFTDIITITGDIDESDLSRYFPYKIFLEERKNASIHIIRWDKLLLDRKYPNRSNENNRLLSKAYTDSLFENEKSAFSAYNPDYLINLLQWTESFRYAALIDEENEILYASIFDFWLNKITSNLVSYSTENVSIKYDFKYRYLESKCTEYGFTFGTKVSSLEKVIYNIVDSNWMHLFDASWNQSSILQKIIFLLILIITCFGYGLFLKKVIIFFKSK
jgi:hypothetical protein